MMLSRRSFIELSGGFLLCGCANTSSTNNSSGSNFPVLVFSDVHFQPFISPFTAATLAANMALVAQLDAADTSQWPAILQASATAPSAYGADTNYPLLALALESIQQNLGASPAVLNTGDFLGHGVDQLYTTYSTDKSAAAAMAFVDKTLTFVLQQIRGAVGNLPVYFALGNCDSYTGYGPNSAFLASNAQRLHSLALNGAGDRQAFITTVADGGYYAAESTALNLMVIGLNSIALSPLVPADPAMIAAQFAWLDGKLAEASAAGKKVWLLMHAPPGADEGTTGEPANDNGKLTTATMMWVDIHQATFMGIIEKYPGVIAMTLAGHTHMDEFRLISQGNVLEITAGISPVFGNNPAYKIFTMDSLRLAPTDFSAVNCNLQTTPLQFSRSYVFSQSYAVTGSLADSLVRLFPTLKSSISAQTLYRGNFISGNTSANAITDLNWPVYWCGIGTMTQADLITAVNSY
jgi:hypothetical protein